MNGAFSLQGKVCVVTGAGKGIGRQTAKLFHAQGARLALISRSREDLESLRVEAGLNDADVLLTAGDVAQEQTVEDFIAGTVAKFGRVDVLVNNAGMRFRKAFLEITPQEWQQVQQTNLGSVYLLCRSVGRHMVQQRSGRIVNVASIIGTLGLPELAAYGASKGGMITLTKCLALEWAPHNITVNAVAPGFCETSYAENFKKRADLYAFTIERTPLKRWGSADDAAQACLFLASDAAAYITGEVLHVDGGWTAW